MVRGFDEDECEGALLRERAGPPFLCAGAHHGDAEARSMDELWGAVGRGGARWARGRCALIIIVEDAVGGGGEVVKLAGAGGPDESEYGSGGDEQGEGEDEEEDDHGAPGVESLSR